MYLLQRLGFLILLFVSHVVNIYGSFQVQLLTGADLLVVVVVVVAKTVAEEVITTVNRFKLHLLLDLFVFLYSVWRLDVTRWFVDYHLALWQLLSS